MAATAQPKHPQSRSFILRLQRQKKNDKTKIIKWKFSWFKLPASSQHWQGTACPGACTDVIVLNSSQQIFLSLICLIAFQPVVMLASIMCLSVLPRWMLHCMKMSFLLFVLIFWIISYKVPQILCYEKWAVIIPSSLSSLPSWLSGAIVALSVISLLRWKLPSHTISPCVPLTILEKLSLAPITFSSSFFTRF